MIGKRKRRVHVFSGKDGDWYWQLKAGNGEIIAGSTEGYRNLDDCVVIATEVNPGIETVLHQDGKQVVLEMGE